MHGIELTKMCKQYANTKMDGTGCRELNSMTDSLFSPPLQGGAGGELGSLVFKRSPLTQPLPSRGEELESVWFTALCDTGCLPASVNTDNPTHWRTSRQCHTASHTRSYQINHPPVPVVQGSRTSRFGRGQNRCDLAVSNVFGVSL